MILQWDESFDIGFDTLTGVNDADYKPPSADRLPGQLVPDLPAVGAPATALTRGGSILRQHRGPTPGGSSSRGESVCGRNCHFLRHRC